MNPTFEQFFEASPFCILATDLEGKIVLCNRLFLETSGFPLSELVGENIYEFFLESDQREQMKKSFQEIVDKKCTSSNAETPLLAKDGKSKDFWWRISPLLDSGDAVTGIQLVGDVLLDVMDAHARLETLQNSDGNRKRDIVSFVAHELRGGLTSIDLGLRVVAELLDRNSNPELVRSTVGKMLKKSSHLTRLTGNLLSSLEKLSHPLRVNLQACSLGELITSVMDRVRDENESVHNIKIDFEIPERKIIVQWDPIKVDQLLTNLLTNAISFSKPEGGAILLKATTADEEVQLEITDNGIGIPDDSIESIFNMFTRGSNVSQTELNSFGLGLKICKDIVSKHRGRIWAKSKVNEGTTIYLTLPLDPRKLP